MPCNLISSCFFPESPWFREIDCAGPGQSQHQDWPHTAQPGERESADKRMCEEAFSNIITLLEFAEQSAEADKPSNQFDLMFLLNSLRWHQYRNIKINC